VVAGDPAKLSAKGRGTILAKVNLLVGERKRFRRKGGEGLQYSTKNEGINRRKGQTSLLNGGNLVLRAEK